MVDYKKLFWDIHNLERGLNSSLEDSLYNIYRVLKIKESNLNVFHSSDLLSIVNTLENVPYFDGDRRIFMSLYETISKLDNEGLFKYIDYLLTSDRFGFGPKIPESLTAVMLKNFKTQKNVLINDCEKFGASIYNLIENNPNTIFYLTTRYEVIQQLYKLLFKNCNIEFINSDIYSEGFTINKFDLILCFPIMGNRLLETRGDFISKDSSFVAVQNLLYHLNIDGKLVIILPSKIGFGGGDVGYLRDYIENSYKINEISSLPAKLFYPYMSINTYLLSLSLGTTDDISIKKYALSKEDGKEQNLKVEDERLLFFDELLALNGWNVDMVFSMTDESILEYKQSTVKKALLKDVAEVFRGKAITEKTEKGNVKVVNISNMTETGIDYGGLDLINEEERKVARYFLEDGDVLVTTKGFSIKAAVFESQNIKCIPSSNLCVIRPNQKQLNGTYLKLFLDSEVGVKLLKSLQRGTSIVNINYQDICELEIPVPSLDEQLDIVNEYNSGLKLYKETILAAEDAWLKIKNSVQKKLF